MSDPSTGPSPAQCRAARGLLAWSQADLAEAARVGLSTVRDLETERRQVSPELVQAIRAAIEAAGVVLLSDDEGEGVRVTSRKTRRNRR